MPPAVLTIWQVTSSKSWGGRESLPVDLHLEFMTRKLNTRLFCAEGSAIAERHHGRPGITALPFAGMLDGTTLRHLRRELTNRRPSLVISHYSHDLFLLRLVLLGAKNVRLVLVKHVGPGKPKKDIFHRWVYRRVDLVLGVSSYIAERCREAYPLPAERIQVWHPGVAEYRQKMRPDSRRRIRAEYRLTEQDILIGYVARLTPGKGHQELLEAFADLAGTHPQIYLALLGEASAAEQSFAAALARRVTDSPLAGRVIMPGFVESVFEWLAACDIFANPSPKEAFGLNTIEAMAAGLPVLGITGGGTPDIITDSKNGLLAQPGDSHEFVLALARLINDPDLRGRLGQAAREDFLARFALPSAADRLLAGIP
jgi:glycosyltransferase involved in cell wall biosynthesis